ncbi:MAG: beta galactosidase jelly roll domain-containing protein, partial [Muribaculaceae bacterium]|nr:beta galactosidase jelly roll domain-containing protein [Muribaculaceae bacterium]
MNKLFLSACVALTVASAAVAQRGVTTLKSGWRFTQADDSAAIAPGYDDSAWQSVIVPHDWAITGPFDRRHDLQVVAITQDGEKTASTKAGRTGGLPYMGTGWYRTMFDATPGRMVSLLFDGAMSDAHVWVNGHYVGAWPYGYNSFHFDVTPYLNSDRRDNVLVVRLENLPFSSRWYPGAGLYRNVHVIETDSVHIPVWGTCVTTPHVESDFATVKLLTTVLNSADRDIEVSTDIMSPDGEVVATRTTRGRINHGLPVEQNFEVKSPALWSPESPSLYVARTTVTDDSGRQVDSYDTRFGIR